MTEKAASLVNQAKEWATYYGAYPNGVEGAVLTVPLRARAAWEANDAEAFAELFTANGSELAGDNQLKGRDEIRAYMAEAFEGSYRDSRITEEPVEVRLISDDVAVAVTTGGVIRGGEDAPVPGNVYRAMWVLVREDGDWRLLAHQTSPLKG